MRVSWRPVPSRWSRACARSRLKPPRVQRPTDLPCGLRQNRIAPARGAQCGVDDLTLSARSIAMKVGFIGLGIMGRPMAGHLIKGGHELFLHSRSGAPADLLDAGGVACRSGREVAERADVVITIVPDTPDVELVLFGNSGVAEGLSPGKTIVDMSSISPVATKDF